MADTSKTYSLICPDIDCAEEFDIELMPADLAEDGDLITCPGCEESWEWEHDAETDTLTLLPNADDEDEDEEAGDEEEGEDDDGVTA